MKSWKLILPMLFATALGANSCLAASDSPQKFELPSHPPTVENVSKGVIILRGFGATVSNIRVGDCKPDEDIKTSLLCDLSYETDLPASKYVDKAVHRSYSGPHLATIVDGNWRVQPFTEKQRAKRKTDIAERKATIDTANAEAARRIADYRGWAAPVYAGLSLLLLAILWVKLPRMSWNKYDWKAGSGSMPTAGSDGSLAGNVGANTLNAMNGLNLGTVVGLVALVLGVVGWFVGTEVLGRLVLEFARYPVPIDTTWVRVAGAFWVLIGMRSLKVVLGSLLIAGVIGAIVGVGYLGFQGIHWILFSRMY